MAALTSELCDGKLLKWLLRALTQFALRVILSPKMQAAASFIKNGKKVQVIITNSLYIQLTGYQIVAIGRNYAQHVKELNNPMPKEPFFFLKPTTSYVQSGGKVEIPRGIIAHHEGTLS